MTKQQRKRGKRIQRQEIVLPPSSHQPSKAEMNEEIRLDCAPKQLARAVLQDVKIETRAE